MVSELDPRDALPVWLSTSSADARFGLPPVVDSAIRETLLGWMERAEDVQSELESVFDVAFGGDDEDLELLDGIVDAMLDDEPPSEEQLAALALDWGIWLGEWVRGAIGGDWCVREAPEKSSIVFARAGWSFFPVHAVLLRFAVPRQVRITDLVEQMVQELSVDS